MQGRWAWYMLQLGFVVAVLSVLVFVFDMSYIGAVTILFAWAAFGHLVTLDDDAPGEWSNPDGDAAVWRRSLLLLAVKSVGLVLLIWLMARFPEIREYRWR